MPDVEVRPSNLSFWAAPVYDACEGTKRGDVERVKAARQELKSLLDNNEVRRLRKRKPIVKLHYSRLNFWLGGEFENPFESLQEARVQKREIEKLSHDMPYRRLFVDAIAKSFPKTRGFDMLKRVFENIDDDVTPLILDTEDDVQIARREGAELTILAFSCIRHSCAGLSWGLFDAAVAHPLNANLIILKDFDKRLFLRGVQSLGDYTQTVAALKEILEEFKDTRIVVFGGSGGVFGALNMSADLGIDHIVALAGPTRLDVGDTSDFRQIYGQIADDIGNGLYTGVDLAKRVTDSSIRKIDFFLGQDHAFDRAHLDHLEARCSSVLPHLYSPYDGHIVIDFAIEDGTIFKAFNDQEIARTLNPPS